MLLIAVITCCVVSLGGLGGTDAVLQEVDYEAVNYYDGDYVDYDVPYTYTAVDDVITGARRLNTLRQSPLLVGVLSSHRLRVIPPSPRSVLRNVTT